MTTDPHGDRTATDGDAATPAVDGEGTTAPATPDTTAAAGPLPSPTPAPSEDAAPVDEPPADAPAPDEPVGAGPVPTETPAPTEQLPAEEAEPDEIDGRGAVDAHASTTTTPTAAEADDERRDAMRTTAFAAGTAGAAGGTSSSAGDDEHALPAEDEGATLREERARRFGRRDRTDDDLGTPVATTTATPVVDEPTSTRTMPAATEPATEPAPAPADEDPFRDFDEGPTSRAAAHWWSILAAVVLTPVAWFLIADGGERTSFSLDAGNLNIAGPIELAGGIVLLFGVFLATRWSSVGAIIVGTVALLAGGAYLAVNELATTFVTDNQDILVRLGQLGQNALDYLLADARTGRLAVYGVVLIMAGVISHGARRQGRREERRKAAIGA